MAEPTKTTKRSHVEVQRDLDKARARLRELHPKVEADTRRGNAHNERLKKRLDAWQKLHPDEPFDEVEAGFDLTPYSFNEEQQREFHSLHYEIARLEDELTAANKDRTRA